METKEPSAIANSSPKYQPKQYFIGCLPTESDQTTLAGIFKQYCFEVTGVEIKYRKNGVCAGFGFL